MAVSEVATATATAEELSVHTSAAEPGPKLAPEGASGEAVGADSPSTDNAASTAAGVPLRQSLRLQGLPPAGSQAACVLQLPKAVVPIPRTIQKACASALAEQWAVATDAEMESLHGHRTWELVDPPQGCSPLDNRWVLSVEENSHGNIALCGLRQAPRAWHARLKVELEQLGFAASEADSCLFTMIRGSNKVPLEVYLDNCPLAVNKGDAETMAWVKQRLPAVFDIHQLGSAERFWAWRLCGIGQRAG
ncbi:hypothetical protein QJQ45_015229 [Haematococcus lacustris]|nr:hypothetical protein QJQ45_015229 [Haematococcus lacustris]